MEMDLMTPTYYVDVWYEFSNTSGWSCVHRCDDTARFGEVLEAVEHWRAKGHEVRVRQRTEQVIL